MAACFAVRLGVTKDVLGPDDFWDGGNLHRFILGALWDVPEGVRVFIDLGSVRRLDPCIPRDLADRPCAGWVVFEHSDWRLAKQYADTLNATLLAKRVAT